MYKKTYTCRRCGELFTIEYTSLRSMAQGRRAYCEECALIVRKEQQHRTYKKKKARQAIPDRGMFNSSQLNDACDRFFRGRGMAQESATDIRPLPADTAKPKDVVEAVSYGESAFNRYKKLTRKKGAGQNEQT